ncbi:MAG: hypothetical protein RR573_08185, partial [Oscillospiraceae bacterium]
TKMLHFQALTLVREINIKLKLSKKFENVALKFVFVDEIKNKKDKSNNKTIQSDEIQNGKN